MKSLYNYIISTNNRYDNKVSVGDNELILNTEITERDYMFVNRIGTVINSPINLESPINTNDEVIVHHNVFRRWYDVKGRERNSGNYVSENTYTVSPDQIFAYKQNGSWHCPIQYCFVKPLENEDVWSLNSEQELLGELTYTNEYLKSLGLTCGDIVGFTPNSEYEFNIDGSKLYRILSKDITINYGHNKNKKVTS